MRAPDLRFTPGPCDVAVEGPDGIWWVRAVKRGQPLRYDARVFKPGAVAPSRQGAAALLVLRPLAAAVERWIWHPAINRADRWKVGVIDPQGGRWGADKLIHKERLPAGADPRRRVSELVADVKAGRLAS